MKKTKFQVEPRLDYRRQAMSFEKSALFSLPKLCSELSLFKPRMDLVGRVLNYTWGECAPRFRYDLLAARCRRRRPTVRGGSKWKSIYISPPEVSARQNRHQEGSLDRGKIIQDTPHGTGRSAPQGSLFPPPGQVVVERTVPESAAVH